MGAELRTTRQSQEHGVFIHAHVDHLESVRRNHAFGYMTAAPSSAATAVDGAEWSTQCRSPRMNHVLGMLKNCSTMVTTQYTWNNHGSEDKQLQQPEKQHFYKSLFWHCAACTNKSQISIHSEDSSSNNVANLRNFRRESVFSARKEASTKQKNCEHVKLTPLWKQQTVEISKQGRNHSGAVTTLQLNFRTPSFEPVVIWRA